MCRWLARLALITMGPLTVALAVGGDPQADARKWLEPKAFPFSEAKLPFAKALGELMEKTGNSIRDERKQIENPKVSLPMGPTTFWPALDEIGRASGVGFSAYGDGVVLTDTPYRAVPTAYGGIFRVAHRRTTLVRDEETDSRHCQLALDVTWEPRFQPFYVDLKQAKVTFAPDAKGKQLVEEGRGRGKVPAPGRSTTELDVQTAAPDRTSPKIASVEGTVWALGPSKMLTFTFDKLAIQKAAFKEPPTKTEDGVTVSILGIKPVRDEAILVKVKIDNPKGTVSFDSHESWIDNSRMALIKMVGGKQRVLVPVGISASTLQWPRAQVEYEFNATEGQALPTSLDGWTLTYVTPGRIVEVTANFKLENLKLP